VLQRVLARLHPIERDDIIVGLNHPDDAAVVAVPAGKVIVHTVDFFRAIVDDPYIFGKIAANHSLGDIFAMGAQAQTALAIVTVPYGLETKVEDVLAQLLLGADEVLKEAGAILVGGHSSEGAELAMGFAINGLANPMATLRKGGMKPGDRLLLTKPIGTGTLFAADMRRRAKGRWIDAAIQSMLQSNRLGVQCFIRHEATACTDVTGFGLLGHLVEMTKASSVDAEINISKIPWLDGACETVAAGIFSSLQPQNIRLRRAIRNPEMVMSSPFYPLLFDPQTAGGLLASVSADQAEACLAELKTLGYERAAMIGTVQPSSDSLEPISVVLTQ
jgi:selenide,water dikinase